MDKPKVPSALSEAMESIAASQESFRKLSELAVPRLELPDLSHLRVPSPREQNEYQSSGVMLKRLADTIQKWRLSLPKDHQPAVLAVLHGGVIVAVDSLAQESFHGIRVQGIYEAKPCMVLAHQASVQLLCFAQRIEKEEFRRKIGFIIDGEESAV